MPFHYIFSLLRHVSHEKYLHKRIANIMVSGYFTPLNQGLHTTKPRVEYIEATIVFEA
jgi:hypothetical protein